MMDSRGGQITLEGLGEEPRFRLLLFRNAEVAQLIQDCRFSEAVQVSGNLFRGGDTGRTLPPADE